MPSQGILLFLRLNPNRDPLKPCVYVGIDRESQSITDSESQKTDNRALGRQEYGVRLMPELYENLNSMPFEAAVQMEVNWLKI